MPRALPRPRRRVRQPTVRGSRQPPSSRPLDPLRVRWAARDRRAKERRASISPAHRRRGLLPSVISAAWPSFSTTRKRPLPSTTSSIRLLVAGARRRSRRDRGRRALALQPRSPLRGGSRAPCRRPLHRRLTRCLATSRTTGERPGERTVNSLQIVLCAARSKTVRRASASRVQIPPPPLVCA